MCVNIYIQDVYLVDELFRSLLCNSGVPTSIPYEDILNLVVSVSSLKLRKDRGINSIQWEAMDRFYFTSDLRAQHLSTS